MKKILHIGLPFLLLTVILIGGLHYVAMKNNVDDLRLAMAQNMKELQKSESLKQGIRELEKEIAEKQAQQKIYTIIVGGDIMLDRGVEAKIKQANHEYNFAFSRIKEYLQTGDYVFANLEGSISDVGVDSGKKYSFRFEPETRYALQDAGIDLVSLANNHMLDWGRDSLCETTRHLDTVDIEYVGGGCDGGTAERPIILTLGETRVGFLAYTEFYQGAHATESRAGMSEWNIKKIKNRIQDLKKEVDVTIVSLHFGEEYKTRATDTQVAIAQDFIDAGADVIVGHHPHVAQEIERYNKGWIIYSLGNFVFDQYFSENTMKGLLAEILIQNGRIYDIVPKPIELNSDYQPALAVE